MKGSNLKNFHLRLLKKILNRTYRPLLQKYLSADRCFNYNGIRLRVLKGIFHPGFFFSTQFLIEDLMQLPLQRKALLELGCGSGLISVIAAKNGAIVTATDINPLAVLCTRENAAANGVEIKVIESDMFDKIPAQIFDYVIINPPYYRGKANNKREMSWYCGPQLEYFENLFAQIGGYINAQSIVLMVLSEDCEIETIKQMASKNGFELIERRRKKIWWEENFIYQIRKG